MKRIIPLLCAVGFLLFESGCADKVGNPTGPGSTDTNGGMGRLVYSAVDFAQSNLDYSIRMIDSTGAQLGNLGNGLVWSSGAGEFVWFGMHGSDTGVFVTDNALGSSKLIAPGSVANPVISLDGSHVAVTYPTSTYANTQLVVLSGTNFSHQAIISSTVAHETLPCLSPDGSKVAFYDSAEGGRWLTVANTDGSGTIINVPITDWGVDFYGMIDWSPMGNRLAYFDNDLIRVVNVDSRGVFTVDTGISPNWSPDGETLAYSNREGDIILTSDLGHTKQNITNSNQLNEAYPRWSPDGKKIACISWVGNNMDHTTTSVKIIDVATGASRIVATPGFAATWLR